MSFFMNKVFGAILGTLLLVFVIMEVSHRLYPNPRDAGHVENPGYVVAGMEHDGGHEEVAVVEESVDLGALMADADADSGASRFRPCAGCHSVVAGGTGAGPTLWNIVGRGVGTEEGYNYSRAMGALGGDWTYARLFEFLENPRAYVPGTNMSFNGMRRESQRADVIAYLRSLSDSPQPLPAPNAQESSNEVAPEPAAHMAPASHADVEMEDPHSAAVEEAVEEAVAADDAMGEMMGEEMEAKPDDH